MISIEEARKIIKDNGSHLGDEELKKVIEFLTVLSEKIIRIRSE